MPEVIHNHMKVVVIIVNYDVGFLREIVLPDISFPTYCVVC